MELMQKPMFKRAYKKLNPKQKEAVKAAIKLVLENPYLGEEKKQDLEGVFVYKFKVDVQQYLLSYMFDPETLTLIFIGVHENYYRDLKKYLN